jgi:hypothetical protein
MAKPDEPTEAELLELGRGFLAILRSGRLTEVQFRDPQTGHTQTFIVAVAPKEEVFNG